MYKNLYKKDEEQEHSRTEKRTHSHHLHLLKLDKNFCIKFHIARVMEGVVGMELFGWMKCVCAMQWDRKQIYINSNKFHVNACNLDSLTHSLSLSLSSLYELQFYFTGTHNYRLCVLEIGYEKDKVKSHHNIFACGSARTLWTINVCVWNEWRWALCILYTCRIYTADIVCFAAVFMVAAKF